MTKSIPLTKGFFAIVDDEDFDKLNIFKWYYISNRYAARWNGKENICMHREIMNTPDKMETDHINGNGLDNRKENLRICTTSENAKNRKGHGTSKYLGVSWSKKRKKWIAQININGKVKFLGRFDSEVLAAEIYDQYAIKNHKDFARPKKKKKNS